MVTLREPLGRREIQGRGGRVGHKHKGKLARGSATRSAFSDHMRVGAEHEERQWRAGRDGKSREEGLGDSSTGTRAVKRWTTGTSPGRRKTAKDLDNIGCGKKCQYAMH